MRARQLEQAKSGQLNLRLLKLVQTYTSSPERAGCSGRLCLQSDIAKSDGDRAGGIVNFYTEVC